MGYIDPHESDAKTIKRDGVLSHRQAREDYLAAMTANGLDAAIHRSKRHPRPLVPEGWKAIPGQSRSGALDPSTRSRLDRQEREGEIEVLREAQGRPYAFREATS